MTELNKHVVSLELSRRLKELGVKQESYFWWRQDNILCNFFQKGNYHPDFVWYSAYLASELGELLPEEITVGDKTYRLRIKKTHGTKEWLVKYITPKGRRKGYTTLHMAIEGFQRESLAEALGLMLADIIQNHLISVEELGK